MVQVTTVYCARVTVAKGSRRYGDMAATRYKFINQEQPNPC